MTHRTALLSQKQLAACFAPDGSVDEEQAQKVLSQHIVSDATCVSTAVLETLLTLPPSQGVVDVAHLLMKKMDKLASEKHQDIYPVDIIHAQAWVPVLEKHVERLCAFPGLLAVLVRQCIPLNVSWFTGNWRLAKCAVASNNPETVALVWDECLGFLEEDFDSVVGLVQEAMKGRYHTSLQQLVKLACEENKRGAVDLLLIRGLWAQCVYIASSAGNRAGLDVVHQVMCVTKCENDDGVVWTPTKPTLRFACRRAYERDAEAAMQTIRDTFESFC